jgi:hypothetical protein
MAKGHIHDCITDKRIAFLPLVAIVATRVQLGRGREEEREEPGEVTSAQPGRLAMTMRKG